MITDQGDETVARLLICLSQVGQYIVCHILKYYSMGHERLPPPHKRLKTLGALLTRMTGLVLKCCCRYKPPELRHTPLPWRVLLSVLTSCWQPCIPRTDTLKLPLHSTSPVYIRVVRGDINFGILRDPLNFWPLMDQNRPYLTNFLIENGSFLLTKAHVFGANWTEQPSTLEVFLGHLSL